MPPYTFHFRYSSERILHCIYVWEVPVRISVGLPTVGIDVSCGLLHFSMQTPI